MVRRHSSTTNHPEVQGTRGVTRNGAKKKKKNGCISPLYVRHAVCDAWPDLIWPEHACMRVQRMRCFDDVGHARTLVAPGVVTITAAAAALCRKLVVPHGPLPILHACIRIYRKWPCTHTHHAGSLEVLLPARECHAHIISQQSCSTVLAAERTVSPSCSDTVWSLLCVCA